MMNRARGGRKKIYNSKVFEKSPFKGFINHARVHPKKPFDPENSSFLELPKLTGKHSSPKQKIIPAVWKNLHREIPEASFGYSRKNQKPIRALNSSRDNKNHGCFVTSVALYNF